VTASANLVHHLLSTTTSRIVTADHITASDELKSRVGLWAAHLRSRHEQGSRVGLVSRNDEAFIVGYLACLTAGMIVVPMNPLSPEPERARDMATVRMSEVLIGPSSRSEADSVRSAAPDVAVTIIEDENVTAEPLDPMIDAAAVAPDDVAVLLFTSGTAGPSKAAILTHRNLRASLLSMEATGVDLRSHPQAVIALVPLFHVFGLNVIVNLALSVGATIVLHDEFDPKRLVEEASAYDVTILAGPPNMWRSLARLDPSETAALRTLDIAVSGAAPLDPTVAKDMRNRHGVDLREGYGLTETAAVLSSGFGIETMEVGSVGVVMPGVECRLVDTEGHDVLIGDIGEVWVKGPMVSPGYWEDDEATKLTRTDDGWFRTGDLATVDEDGHLSISGRTKDLVIVAGFNVHPAEVENVLQGHPAVESAAVVGIPDDSTGERVKAFVTLHADADAEGIEERLLAVCYGSLARYKVLKSIEVRDELPVGIAGKVRRRDLTG
jgi:long-chain acyl-CoA synthetase